MTDRQLMSMAKEASLYSYIPYSHFAVGAALECDERHGVYRMQCGKRSLWQYDLR